MKKIKLGIIGCSDIVHRAHYPALSRLQEQFEITALCDKDSKRLAWAGQTYRASSLYSDSFELFSNSGVDAILNATPTAAHAEITIAALNRGYDVLCEKPMAITIDEAEKMQEAAKRNKRILQVAFMSRYAAGWRKIRDLVCAGEIGEIISCTLTQYWDSGQALYEDWRTDPQISGGGILADSASHWIDIMRWICGEITAVSALGIAAPDSPCPAVEDSAFVMMRFQSGAIGLLRNAWRHIRPNADAEEFEIYGTRGSILAKLRTPWRDAGPQTVQLLHGDGSSQYWEFNAPLGRFEAQLADFARLINERNDMEASGNDGIRALAIQMAMYRSMAGQCWETTRPEDYRQ